jgi:hypothetical protein
MFFSLWLLIFSLRGINKSIEELRELQKSDTTIVDTVKIKQLK